MAEKSVKIVKTENAGKQQDQIRTIRTLRRCAGCAQRRHDNDFLNGAQKPTPFCSTCRSRDKRKENAVIRVPEQSD